MIKLVTLFACAINAAVPRADISAFNRYVQYLD